jgi:CheY-like chemotaxis protein
MAQKILIVEDNFDLSKLLAFCLNNAGYETPRAGNLEQGISKALGEHPDLIITDLCLPDMTAVDATVILKQDPRSALLSSVVALLGVVFTDTAVRRLDKSGYSLSPFKYWILGATGLLPAWLITLWIFF